MAITGHSVMCKANKRLQVKVHTQRTAFIGTDIGALLWTILIHFPYKKEKKQKKQTNDLVIRGKIAANSQLYNLIYKIVYFLRLFFLSFFAYHDRLDSSYKQNNTHLNFVLIFAESIA